MRAHTVILGAGVTIAAIQNGDKYRNKSFVMNGLIEKLHLDDVLSRIELKSQSDNLVYSRLEGKEAVNQLEKRL